MQVHTRHRRGGPAASLQARQHHTAGSQKGRRRRARQAWTPRRGARPAAAPAWRWWARGRTQGAAALKARQRHTAGPRTGRRRRARRTFTARRSTRPAAAPVWRSRGLAPGATAPHDRLPDRAPTMCSAGLNTTKKPRPSLPKVSRGAAAFSRARLGAGSAAPVRQGGLRREGPVRRADRRQIAVHVR